MRAIEARSRCAKSYTRPNVYSSRFPSVHSRRIDSSISMLALRSRPGFERGWPRNHMGTKATWGVKEDFKAIEVRSRCATIPSRAVGDEFVKRPTV